MTAAYPIAPGTEIRPNTIVGLDANGYARPCGPSDTPVGVVTAIEHSNSWYTVTVVTHGVVQVNISESELDRIRRLQARYRRMWQVRVLSGIIARQPLSKLDLAWRCIIADESMSYTVANGLLEFAR